MLIETLGLLFLEGLASFLSPCVLPLLPVYFSYLAGSTVDEILNKEELKKTFYKNSIGFVLGLSFVFLSLGMGANAIGQFIFKNNYFIKKIAAAIIILFGIHLSGIINIKALNYEKRLEIKKTKPKFLYAFLLGITFSFGWTPCIGAMLGSVLLMAGNAQNMLIAVFLMGVYSLGLSIPFLIATLAVGKFIRFYTKIYKYFGIIKLLSAVVLIIIGVLMFFNKI